MNETENVNTREESKHKFKNILFRKSGLAQWQNRND